MTALGRVENFVGKVAAEEITALRPPFLDRRAESVIITIETDEDSPFSELFFEIFARLFALFRPAEKLPSRSSCTWPS